MNSRYRLICLDAKTGQPVESFGTRRRDRSRRRPGVADQQEALLEHVAAGRLQGSRHPRQRRRRSADVQQRSARRRAGVQRAHRQAGVELPHHPAAGRVRQRDVEERRRGRSPATPTSGRRCRSTSSAGCSTCRSSTPSNDYYGGRRLGANLVRARRSSASTRRPASASGTSRSCTTACGTTTRRRRRTW